MKEVSSYVFSFSPLREGDIAPYRGSGNSGSLQRYRAVSHLPRVPSLEACRCPGHAPAAMLLIGIRNRSQ